MAKRKFLVLFRSQPTGGHPGPSPEQMQQMFAAYKAWKEKFKDDIFDLGDKLKSEGRVVTASGVADGPFVEVKEVVGGYMIVSAENYDGAVEYGVAHNNLMAVLRKDQGHQHILDRDADQGADNGEEPVSPAFAGEVRDELLRMLFVCCDEKIPEESRLVLALKTLCGFSTGEIAFRLFTTEANVYKRLARARDLLRRCEVETQTPPLESLRSRLPSVHAVIYLLFNEGYLSTHGEHAIRAELCEEAIRLGTLLATYPVGAAPPTFALLALMHLHAARLASRQDATGGLLLLEEQDRSLWDAEHLLQGATWLAQAADGDVFTRFHAEAGIAAEHCFAPSFADTRWNEIAELYAMLERIDPSPIHTLNRAVAVAEGQGPQAGLAALDGMVLPAWLDGHYLWDAVLADLHHRAGNAATAERHRDRALAAAPSTAVRQRLQRRLTATRK